jgi:hypothetical protein
MATETTATLADRMYPSTTQTKPTAPTPKTETAPAPGPVSLEKLANSLWGDYDIAMRAAFTDTRDAQLIDLGRSVDQAKAEEQEHIALLREAGLPAYSSLGAELWKVKVANDLADQRHIDPDPTIDERRIDARIAEASPRIRAELRATWGDRTDDLLARFRKFVSASPALKALIERRDNGSNENLVRLGVEYVNRINYR